MGEGGGSAMLDGAGWGGGAALCCGSVGLRGGGGGNAMLWVGFRGVAPCCVFGRD